MKEDWNEELRRAYDRGYWDARREVEREQSMRRGRSDDQERSGGGHSAAMSYRGTQSYEEGRDRGRADDRESGWTPEWSDERRREVRGQTMRGRGAEDDMTYRRDWRDRAGSYERGWSGRSGDRDTRGAMRGDREDQWSRQREERPEGTSESWRRRESAPGLSSADYDTSGYGTAEDRWSGRSVHRFEEDRNSELEGRRDYDPGQRRDVGRIRDDYRDRRERRDDRDEDRRDRGDDRGFFERAGDEIRSWFSDEDDERRRR